MLDETSVNQVQSMHWHRLSVQMSSYFCVRCPPEEKVIQRILDGDVSY